MASTSLYGLEFTGLRELNASLKKMGVTDDAVKTAMNEAGAITQREAWRLMPVSSGAMARTLKVNKNKNVLKVTVGNNTTVRYAYTFHATGLGLSRGGFTFRVPAHSRRGRPVRGYVAQRRIPNRPFLYLAWERTKQQVYEAYVEAIGNLIRSA